MLRSFTNGIMALGLMAGLLTGCESQDAVTQVPKPNTSATNPGTPTTPTVPDPGPTTPDTGGSQPPSTDDEILALYDHFDPTRLIDTKLLRVATLYFHKNKTKFTNQKALTIIDFSLHSSKKRFYLMNVETGEVWATYTAHGSGSDPGTYDQSTGYAQTFSNVSGSNATSLGAYLTAETYSGSHGYSLRLDGLSSTNSNARRRAIVVHGASYVLDEVRKQGRSQGCPALAMEYYEKVINLIKGGSLMYAGASARL